MRKKWNEKVEFIECSADKEQNKIVMFNDTTGDIYLSVCPKEHNSGKTVRIERSGGAITKNPRMVVALGLLYDSIAGNYEEFDNKVINNTVSPPSFIEIFSNISLILENNLNDKDILLEELKNYYSELNKNFQIISK